MVTASILFLNDQATLWAVCQATFINSSKEFIHCAIHLTFAVFVYMIRKGAPHAYLIFASLTFAVVWITSSKEAICFFAELLSKIRAFFEIVVVHPSVAIDVD